jgi:transcriptional regulator with XRE-family HTH domain
MVCERKMGMKRRKKATPRKVKSVPDWAQDIRKLSTVLGCGTQEEFAARVGSKQGTVSTWLRGDEARRPSADTFVRMAGLAIKFDPSLAARFLQQAKVSKETILSIANQISTEMIVHPQKGESFLIPRVEKTAHGLRELGTSIVMPVELIPNPGSTYCFGVSFTPGEFDEWAIVDTSDAEAEGLGRFWGLPVLIEFTPGDRSRPLGLAGLEIGALYLEEDEQTPQGTPWYVRFLQPHIGGLLLGASARIGMWMESQDSRIDATLVSDQNDFAAGRETQKEAASRALNAIRSDRASRAVRLAPGCKVIGRVITWWYACQEP